MSKVYLLRIEKYRKRVLVVKFTEKVRNLVGFICVDQ